MSETIDISTYSARGKDSIKFSLRGKTVLRINQRGQFYRSDSDEDIIEVANEVRDIISLWTNRVLGDVNVAVYKAQELVGQPQIKVTPNGKFFVNGQELPPMGMVANGDDVLGVLLYLKFFLGIKLGNVGV